MLVIARIYLCLSVCVESDGGRLSMRAIQNMIAEAGKRARIEEPVTPHILRHTCAFMLRQAGADIETRAKMLGHSIETASKYGAPGESEIEKAASLLDYAGSGIKSRSAALDFHFLSRENPKKWESSKSLNHFYRSRAFQTYISMLSWQYHW